MIAHNNMQRRDTESAPEVIVIGAGPIGIEMAVALEKAGIPYLVIEKGQIGQTVMAFPPMMQFFSSVERIALAGVPIPKAEGSKCSREEYLAYLRAVVTQFNLKIRTYETVESLQRLDCGGFLLQTRTDQGAHEYTVPKVVLATGDTHRARRLNIPGENLPHVRHWFDEPHRYYRRKVLVIGGRNSAVEAALRCLYAEAHVTLCHRGQDFDPQQVKYWLLPELRGRVRRGEISLLLETEPVSFRPGIAELRRRGGSEGLLEIEADFVLAMIGFEADMSLFRESGVELAAPGDVPRFSEDTMETNIAGLYVAGTATAGSQQAYHVFIETSHIHVERIMAHLQGMLPPAPVQNREMPES